MSCRYSWPQRDIPAFGQCSGTKTYFRLFLLLNPTLSPVKELLTLHPSCFAGWRMWPNDCSCQGNLFGMHANNSSPLPRCPGLPVMTTIPSSAHIAAQPPWKPIWNCFGSYQRMMFLIQIVLFKSFTKAAVINCAGGLCKMLPLGKL